MKLILLLVLLVFVSACVSQSPEEYNDSELRDITEETENNTFFERDLAMYACEDICNGFLDEGVNLSSGPCLSDNNEDWVVADWVCDVAHLPRIAADDNSENQCSEYRTGQAHHFVEVDENCDIIRAV